MAHGEKRKALIIQPAIQQKANRYWQTVPERSRGTARTLIPGCINYNRSHNNQPTYTRYWQNPSARTLIPVSINYNRSHNNQPTYTRYWQNPSARTLIPVSIYYNRSHNNPQPITTNIFR